MPEPSLGETVVGTRGWRWSAAWEKRGEGRIIESESEEYSKPAVTFFTKIITYLNFLNEKAQNKTWMMKKIIARRTTGAKGWVLHVSKNLLKRL